MTCLHRWMDFGETLHMLHVDDENVLIYCDLCDYTTDGTVLWDWYKRHVD